MPGPHLYLASRSPRRQELLRQVGVRYALLDVDVAERPAAGQSPADYAVATALAKARAGARAAPRPLPVLGADTDVVLDGRILGKPRDRADGVSMLRSLAGRTHEVYSGVALVQGTHAQTALSVTEVTFGPIARAQAERYWDSGEGADKAGAYAIQGLGAQFVRAIHGSYSGVVGLPLYETCELLRRFGIVPHPDPLPADAGRGDRRAARGHLPADAGTRNRRAPSPRAARGERAGARGR